MKKVLLTATVQSHIAQFHLPLINMLKENGYIIHVAARNNLNEKNGLRIIGADEVFDIPFERSPLRTNNIKAYKKLKEVIRNNNYDVIHCNTPMGGIITRLAAKNTRKNGTKVIYTAHGFHFYKGASIKNWIIYYPIEKFMCRYTDILITITKEDYKLANNNFNVKVKRINGVGVNTEKYFKLPFVNVDKKKNELGINSNKVILCIGELNKNKNQINILKALVEIKREFPDVKLLLAGNGPLLNYLKEKVKEYGIEKEVEFLGYRTDLNDFINISDIIVSSSLREGLPLNVMEAMVCGKPAIVSDNRGHRELIEDSVNGYIIKTNNSVEFAEKIKLLLNDSELYEKLSRNCIDISKKYIAINIINDIEKCYR